MRVIDMDNIANPVELVGAKQPVAKLAHDNTLSIFAAPHTEFSSVLKTVGAGASSVPIAIADETDRQIGNPIDIQNAKVAHDFEVVVLSQFLGDLFSQSSKTLFGDGLQSDIIGLLFTDALAKQLAQKNGLGIAKMIDES